MQKKFFIFFLALAASVGSMSAAVVNGTCGDNITWSLNTKDSTLTISGSGAMWSWENNVNNLMPWYDYRAYIAYVQMDDEISSIGNYAFWYCQNLKNIDTPIKLESIGSHAFDHCTKLKAINIPDETKSIYNSAFTYSGLVNVSLPNSVTLISSDAFYHCSAMKSINIPNTITIISDGTFCGCSSLTSIDIPDKVKEIQMNAFANCTKLTTVTIGKGIEKIYSSAFGGLYGCPITSLTILAVIPPSGGVDCDIPAANCTLYVPAIAYETYANTLWWEDFKEIIAIPSQNPVVTFKDWNGTTLSSVEVEVGTAATAPADPSREGYTFTGWDQDFSNVTEDMTITALYQINQFQIAVASNDDAFGSIEGENGTFDYLSEHTYTAVPSEGHYFVRWSDDVTDNPRTIVLTQDVALTAFFATIQYTITWQDEEGNVITTDEVGYGLTPEFTGTTPTKEGYDFVGWLPNIKPVTKDICYTTYFIPQAQAEEKVYTVNINGENCSLNINNQYPEGTVITIEAVADECFEFQQWSDGNKDNPRTVTVTKDMNLTAEFNKLRYTVTGEPSTGGQVQIRKQ